MKLSKISAALAAVLAFSGCSEQETSSNKAEPKQTHQATATSNNEFKWQVDRFADIRVIRYQVPGFEELPLETKELLFYLYKAALSGRDITWDHNYKYNLTIRHTLEAVIADYAGDKSSEEFKKFNEYTKRVWFSNGIHHHYMSGKFSPEFSPETFESYVMSVAEKGKLPLNKDQSAEQLVALLTPILFDPTVAPKMVNQSANIDNVVASSVNYYEGVTEQEVENFYKNKVDGLEF